LSGGFDAFAADIINHTVTGGNSVQHGEYGGVVPYEEDFVGDITGSTFDNNQVDTTGQVWGTPVSITNIGGGAIGVATFTGTISNTAFRNNTVIVESANTRHANGGALNVSTADTYPNTGGKFTGSILNTVFENNTMTGTSQAQWYGGAAYFADFEGQLRDSQFIGNTITPTWVPGADTLSVITVGGAVNFHVMRNSVLDNLEFRDNSAMYGGAIRSVRAFNSQLNNSRFINNQGHYGGALSLYEDDPVPTANLVLDNNTFIANAVTGKVLYGGATNQPGFGGAVEIWNHTGNFTFNNNVFLGNRADNESGLAALNGWGGAMAVRAYVAGDMSAVTLSANNGGRTLLYGNRHNGDFSATDTTPNALHFGNADVAGVDRIITTTLDAAVNSRILMLDPLSSQQDGFFGFGYGFTPVALGNLATVITKTGAGDWYLGGESQMRGASTWNIGDGSLFLTTVDYGGATGVQAAHVNLAHTGTADFTLGAGATLAGSGSVTAQNIVLNGKIAPEVWVNTGMRADAITTSISQADINGIDVAKDADFGELVLNGSVTMNGAVYDVDINVDASQQDKLTINGALDVAGASTVNVASLTYTNPPVPDQDTDLYALAKVITTTGGITGADNISVTAAGVNLTNVDFLQAHGSQQGDDYELALGLRWHSNRLDGAGLAEAHGDFTIAGANTFTINGDLTARTATYSDANNASGWDGNSLTKIGDGTLVLNGNNTYTGGTSVQAGTLMIGDRATPTASITSDVTVASGATLTGTGTITGDVDVSGWLRGTTTIIGSVIMRAGSTLAPGFSPGTQTVGSLTLASGSTFNVEVNEHGQSDQVIATAGGGAGTITIAPNVTLNLVNDGSSSPSAWKLNTRYDILVAETSLTGQFDTVNNTVAFLDAELDYTSDPLKVQLHMKRNNALFGDYCATYNQCSVAGALDGLEQNPAHPLVAAFIDAGLTPQQIRDGYDNLSGEIYASTRAAMLGSRRLRDAVIQRARVPLRDEKLWFDTWGFDGRHKGQTGIAQADHRGIGIALGANAPLSGTTTIGAVLGYEDDTVKHGASRHARAEVKAVSAGAYLASTIGGVKLNAGALYSYLDTDTQRRLWIPTLQGRAKSDAKGHKVQVFAEVAKDFQLGNTTVTPYAGVAQTWLKSNAARESADGQANLARLNIQGRTDSVTQTTVGVRAAVTLPTTRPVTVYGDLGWSHTFGDVNNKTRNQFAGADERYTIKGTGVAKNTALIGAGVQAQVTPNATVTLGYQGEVGGKRKNHAAGVQVRVRF